MHKRTYLLLTACLAAVLLLAASGPRFSVIVDNPSSQPVPIRDVDNPAVQPFVFPLCGPASLAGPCPSDSFTIPSMTTDGKPVQRFVLEYVSGECVLTVGSFYNHIAVATSANGGSGFYQAIPVLVGTDGLVNEFNVAQELRGYADAGTAARLDFSTTGPGFPQCTATVSGYLVTK